MRKHVDGKDVKAESADCGACSRQGEEQCLRSGGVRGWERSRVRGKQVDDVRNMCNCGASDFMGNLQEKVTSQCGSSVGGRRPWRKREEDEVPVEGCD